MTDDFFRAAQRNLQTLYNQRGKLKPDKERKKSELERALPSEIQLGYTIIQRREFNEVLNDLLMKEKLTPEENGMAEELQSMVDNFDAEIGEMTVPEQRRCVRLWNKSRKARYKLC